MLRQKEEIFLSNDKSETGQVDDYTTECLLDYTYFKKYFELIAIDFSKQEKLDVDPKAIQQINFTGSLNRVRGARMYFNIEKAKQTILDFSKDAVKVLWFYFVLIKY